MKTIDQLLDDYEAVLQQYRSILEQEMSNLKKEGQLDTALEPEKRQVVDDLSKNLAMLKSVRESAEPLSEDQRQRLNRVQQRFMQVMKLERELEKSYLAHGESRTNAVRGQAKGGINLAAARRLYGMP